jgi:hypothetical protein
MDGLFHRSRASQDRPFRKGIEDFSLKITQHVYDFHQNIFAIGLFILEIWHPKSQDRLPSKFPG